MAIFKNSTFGNIRKSIGDDVAYRSGGQNILRKKPAYVNDANSTAQQARRSALSIVVDMYRKGSTWVRANFQARAQKHSAYNAFTSEVLKNAVNTVGALATLVFSQLLVSKGTMPSPRQLAFTDGTDGSGEIDVPSQADGVQVLPNDLVKCVLIDDITLESRVTDSVSAGYAGTIDLEDTQLWGSGDKHVYVYLANSQGTATSDSVYLGTVDKYLIFNHKY